jgi:riboflavin kinase
MKDAFDSLNTLSPDDVAPAWRNKPKIPLKYSRTDDTQAFYYGKSSDDEIEHYLKMQQELEGDILDAKESSETDQKKDILSDLFEEDEDNLPSLDTDAQHPWSSINPILRLRGPIATGYGRGGKKLGVPTANLPSSLFKSALESVDAGVYFGWAVIEGDNSKEVKNRPIKAVVNVGYSPTFEGKENKEKIVEAHLITKASPMIKYEGNTHIDADETEKIKEEVEIKEDFYGETMRLQLIGFLRPEQKFDSFPDLIAQIHRDIGHAASALDSFPYVFSKDDEFISNHSGAIWIGSDGGDDDASWEYEVW